ncbi:hypothetical protein [Streptomyces klenkii]
MSELQLTAGVTYAPGSSTVIGVVVPVPVPASAKSYGWVDFAATGKKVTGA